MFMTEMNSPWITVKDGKHELKFRKVLFWDIDTENLDLKKNRRLIIERVFSRGNLEEFAQILNYYSEREIREIVIKIGTLDKKTLNFISRTFNLELKEFNASKGIS
jgi:hypothetical protein